MSVNPSAGDLYYDPLDFQVDEKAQEIWKRLRDEAPLYWNEKYQFFALSRYDDILRAVVDTETFSSAHGTTLEMMGPEIDPMSESMMIFMDPPAHSWHRKVVSRAFTPRRLETLEERLVHLCNRLLDGLDGRTEFDFLEDYGAVIPPTVILSLLGFPDGHEEQWRRDVDAALSIEHRASAEESPGQVSATSTEMGVSILFRILPGLIEERRSQPEE